MLIDASYTNKYTQRYLATLESKHTFTLQKRTRKKNAHTPCHFIFLINCIFCFIRKKYISYNNYLKSVGNNNIPWLVVFTVNLCLHKHWCFVTHCFITSQIYIASKALTDPVFINIHKSDTHHHKYFVTHPQARTPSSLPIPLLTPHFTPTSIPPLPSPPTISPSSPPTTLPPPFQPTWLFTSPLRWWLNAQLRASPPDADECFLHLRTVYCVFVYGRGGGDWIFFFTFFFIGGFSYKCMCII